MTSKYGIFRNVVQTGSAIGVVVETANSTEIGKINQALQTVEQQTTPLVRKIHQLNKQIFRGIIFLSLFLIFFTTFRYGLELNFLFLYDHCFDRVNDPRRFASCVDDDPFIGCE